MIDDYVSIILPCYNTSAFISETIKSILKQSYVQFELIIVNDGSTDNSEQIILSFKDLRVKLINQNNQGVSSARNSGLKLAQGEFIIFFDADDIMSDDFLQSRINVLKLMPNIHGVGGKIIAFNLKNENVFNSICPGENAIKDILLYNLKTSTCPSNYLFKHTFLKQNKLSFNTNLHSTADRFFLLEVSKIGSLFYSNNIAPLHYRVSEASMSGKLNYALLNDNIRYFNLLKINHIIPYDIKTQCVFLHYYIFMGSYFKLKNYPLGVKYLLLCFLNNPVLLLKKMLLKVSPTYSSS